MTAILAAEEYVEQAYLFGALAKQFSAEGEQQQPLQTMLGWLKQEILATTKLPLAIDYLLAEIKHVGTMSTALSKLSHYFSAFQTYLISEAEREDGKFDIWQAFRILHEEAKLRSVNVAPNAMFFFQFETLCRNRLNYDYGLEAIARDPIYDAQWSAWIYSVRHKVSMVDITDLVYVHSEYYVANESRRLGSDFEVPVPLLFSEKEGRIALANRRKEPLFFFSNLQRHLNFPASPKPIKYQEQQNQLPKLMRQIERLETRIKLLEEEQRQHGIDLSQFYKKPTKLE